MTVKRHLLIGAVGLVKGRVRDDGKAMVSICDELEPHFVDKKLLDGAPFDVISLILRYGTKETGAKIGRINKRHAELEVAIELPMEEVRALQYGALRQRIRNVTLDALIAVSDKYDLNATHWQCMRKGEHINQENKDFSPE